MLDTLVRDASITTIAAAAIIVEFVAIALVARSRPAMRLLPYVANGLAGLGLVLALRSALLGLSSTSIALWLTVALAAHLVDLVQRLRGGSRNTSGTGTNRPQNGSRSEGSATSRSRS